MFAGGDINDCGKDLRTALARVGAKRAALAATSARALLSDPRNWAAVETLARLLWIKKTVSGREAAVASRAALRAGARRLRCWRAKMLVEIRSLSRGMARADNPVAVVQFFD